MSAVNTVNAVNKVNAVQTSCVRLPADGAEECAYNDMVGLSEALVFCFVFFVQIGVFARQIHFATLDPRVLNGGGRFEDIAIADEDRSIFAGLKRANSIGYTENFGW
jgi:hypothetical protein